jgi:hypothetical protein
VFKTGNNGTPPPPPPAGRARNNNNTALFQKERYNISKLERGSIQQHKYNVIHPKKKNTNTMSMILDEIRPSMLHKNQLWFKTLSKIKLSSFFRGEDDLLETKYSSCIVNLMHSMDIGYLENLEQDQCNILLLQH